MYPDGAETVHHVPWFLQEAIQQALTILSWYENATDDDSVPPEYLWEDTEALEAFFKRKRADREVSSGGEDIAPMSENDLARMWKDE